MAIYRGPGGTGDSAATPGSDASVASTAAANAAASAIAAASSASSAGVDAGTAQNAANNAANSETAAGASATSAAASASASSTSAAAALASQIAAALSATNTASLYDSFDDRYLGVKTTSPAVDNDGNTLQTGALYFNSTTNDMYVWTGSLWTTVSNTTTSTNAATSAAAALTSQNAASTSASNAATSATNASNSASTASTQASNASSSASAASTSASNASSSASSASSSASTATTQASNASTSATNAASSATAASGSASAASTSASNASTSASNAATSATNAAASYDAFDDRYLGAKSSAPTLDNDGNALLTGAIYWSTAVNSLYVWDGSAWLPAAFSSAGNVTSFNTRTGAITLTSSDVTTALTYTPVTNARSLTINGTSYDLTADRTWTIDALPSQATNSGKYLKTDGTSASWDALDISTADITGTLPVANGGTGAVTLTGIAKGNGTSAFTVATSGTDYSAGTSALATGILKSTTTTGALSIAVAADFPTLNQNTTGTAAGLSSTLVVGSGGTGTSTAFTTGSVVFAGASGVYSQDNANFFWDDTNNRLGIGTTSPSNLLTVGSSTNRGTVSVISTSSTSAYVKLDATAVASGKSYGIMSASSANGNFDIYDFTSAAYRLTIDSTGNVGIGTTSPASTLEVAGLATFQKGGNSGITIGNVSTNSGSVIRMQGTSAGYNWQFDNNVNATGLSFTPSTATGGTTYTTPTMVLTGAGNVGIGTNSPTTKLEVAGTVKISTGNMQVPNTNGITLGDDIAGGFLSYGYNSGRTNAAGHRWYNGVTTELMRIDSSGNILVAQAARGTITTDNDLSFDMNAASNFKCTPAALGTLTFTNITSGQSGWVLLVNTGGYAISAASTTKVSSAALTTISTAGTYLLSYFTDGTNVYVTYSGAMA